jgi:hypothetical protein
MASHRASGEYYHQDFIGQNAPESMRNEHKSINEQNARLMCDWRGFDRRIEHGSRSEEGEFH